MSNYCFYSQDALALAQSAGVDVIITAMLSSIKNKHIFFADLYLMRM